MHAYKIEIFRYQRYQRSNLLHIQLSAMFMIICDVHGRYMIYDIKIVKHTRMKTLPKFLPAVHMMASSNGNILCVT